MQQQPVIIAVTAGISLEDKEVSLNAGMDDYLSKPLKLQDIVGVLEKWGKKIDSIQ